jgi:hypothetical protein
VVSRALDGESDQIKERIIAVEVFGRDPSSDLDHNSIVRVGAREVRKRLVQYYAAEGADATIRIDLPTGRYSPSFQELRAAVSPAPLAVVSSNAISGAGRRRMWVWIALTMLATLALTVLARRTWQPPAQPFDVFWWPLLQQKTPTLIVMPVRDKYVGLGDSAAAFDLGALMGKQGHPAHVRIAGKLEFADLCDSGAVLIGAYTNRWTTEILKDARYRFGLSGDNPAVIDSKGGRVWTLGANTSDENENKDYMIIGRVLQNSTGQFVVTAAGLTQYGTGEAGRILTTPDLLTGILAGLPAVWRTRNLELVLHSETVGDFPGPPTVVAWWIW